jgi:hypothetical protein
MSTLEVAEDDDVHDDGAEQPAVAAHEEEAFAASI